MTSAGLVLGTASHAEIKGPHIVDAVCVRDDILRANSVLSELR